MMGASYSGGGSDRVSSRDASLAAPGRVDRVVEPALKFGFVAPSCSPGGNRNSRTMPQPIREPCSVEFVGLDSLPKHAARLGQIIAVSGMLESQLGLVLAILAGARAAVAIPMFHAAKSTDVQRDMLIAAAKHRLGGRLLDEFLALMDDWRPLCGEHHKLVHNVWGVSPQHPNKAVWCDATDVAGLHAVLGRILDNFADIGSLTPEAALVARHTYETVSDLSTRCLAYSVKDLEDARDRLREYAKRVQRFSEGLIDELGVTRAASAVRSASPPSG